MLTAGLHEPVIPLSDVVGNTGAVLFWQTLATGVKVGVTSGSTVMLKVVVDAH